MCGVNGIFGIEDTQKLRQGIGSMNQSLSHRGPNDEGEYYDKNLGLGHRRLSILDLSKAGHQPMKSFNDRYVIVFNGEIYNYMELKHKLKDYPYHSNTDTEVILAAYIKWGKSCVNKFNGMFAFAIWDEKNRELFIARDRLGIKPLYYYRDESSFVFSSEIRGVLNSGCVPREINRRGLVDYLKYQTVHAPDTIVKNVKMLPPGCSMTVCEEGMEIKKYWDINSYKNSHKELGDYKQVKRRVRNLLGSSIEKRLISDVPIGAFLSGGIDSSAVVGLMSKLSPGNVSTFSVTFEESEFSEALYSRKIAQKFNTDHTEIRLTPDDFLELLPQALDAMDHPSVDGPNTYVVSRVTREAGVTVALSGLGGDELFAGYKNFTRAYRLKKFKMADKLPSGLRSMVGSAAQKLLEEKGGDKIKAIFDLNNWEADQFYPVMRQVNFEESVEALLEIDIQTATNRVSEITAPFFSKNSSNHFLSKISRSEIATYMQNILLRDTDQMSMANALEVRVPFLDHELVEYVLSVTDDFKYPHSPKKLLVDSLGDLIPNEIVDRPKMGFVFPWEKWLKEELRERAETRLESLSDRPLFSGEAVREQWNSFLNGSQAVTWPKIWMLVVLEEWLEANDITE